METKVLNSGIKKIGYKYRKGETRIDSSMAENDPIVLMDKKISYLDEREPSV